MEKTEYKNIKEKSWLTKGFAFLKHTFVPLSKKERQKLLDRYEAARDKYLPLIEQRTGVELGEVPIKELRYLTRDSIKQIIKKELEKTDGVIKKAEIISSSFLIYPISKLYTSFLEDTVSAMYSPTNSSIYVPSGFRTKVSLIDEVIYGPNQRIDEFAIHELTHHLWNMIPNRIPLKDTPKLWTEGYAIYGQLDWFSDFLPARSTITKEVLNQDKVYREGRKRIEKLVQKHGEEILLDIPIRWQELEKELTH